MYNLHSHSLLSDGCLLPSEVAIRYLSAGYKVIAITDHVDYSNIDTVVPAIVEFCRRWPRASGITVLPGVELTHVPLSQFRPLAVRARKAGIKVIVAHGETPNEPVLPGTNRAALEAGIDILAHPGKITPQDVKLAKKKGVFLEVTSRKGHNVTNAHVAGTALKYGARIILSHDSHHPDDIITPSSFQTIGKQAGLSDAQLKAMNKDINAFISRCLR